MSGRLCCLASTDEQLLELCHVGLDHLRLYPAVRQIREARVADHVARVACDHKAAGVPLVRGQGQLRGEALGLHQRLIVNHDELALVRPAVPLQLRAAVEGRVGHDERVGGEERGAETVPELVTSPQTTLPVDTPPRVAEGAVQALAVQRARGGRPADGQRGARGSRVGRVVDGECAARDSGGGAQQAHAPRR